MAEKVKQYRHPDDPITLDELKSFLWAAATHLRGQIDAAGYKEYIFPSNAFPMFMMNSLKVLCVKEELSMQVCK
mgnify:FL=1